MLVLLKLLVASFAFSADPNIVFLQSQSTPLKENPKTEAAVINQLKRGDELRVLKKEGLWVQVKTKSNHVGWVPKIFTSGVKPMSQSQLLKDTANLDSSAKTSRKRTTDYAVSAATRGLASTSKHRPGDELFRSNRQAVEELEKLNVSPERVEKFKKDGELND